MALERRKCTLGDPFILDKWLEAWDREDEPTKPTDKENLYDKAAAGCNGISVMGPKWYI